MHGTQNEAVAVKSLQEQEFILVINKCGVSGAKDIPWLVCSLEDLGIICTSKTAFASQQDLNNSPTLRSIEIKMSVALSSLSRAVGNATADLLCV